MGFLILLVVVIVIVVFLVWIVGSSRGQGTQEAPSSPQPPEGSGQYFLEPHSWDEDGQTGAGYVVVRRQDLQRMAWRSLHPTGTSWGSDLWALPVAGTSHREQELQGDAFAPGRALRLVPDPDNPHGDGTAVEVRDSAGDLRVGFVPKGDSKLVFERVTEKNDLQAFVLGEVRKGGQRVALRMLIVPEGASLDLPPDLEGSLS